jgi:hypothetical protein
MNIHAFGVILTRDPSNQTTAYLRRRPHGHWPDITYSYALSDYVSTQLQYGGHLCGKTYQILV